MKGMSNGNGPLFGGLKVPEPPEDLRAQVLSRARQAQESGTHRDLWERLWESRQARVAWGLSVLALAVCHLLLPAGEAGPARQPSEQARVETTDHEELAGIVDLPKLSFDARPRAAMARVPLENDDDRDTAAPPATSEENAS